VIERGERHDVVDRRLGRDRPCAVPSSALASSLSSAAPVSAQPATSASETAPIVLRNVIVNGRTISFTIAVDEESARFTGTMAQDGFSLSGSFTSPDGSGSFSTKRL
jgi:hypothetical protein